MSHLFKALRLISDTSRAECHSLLHGHAARCSGYAPSSTCSRAASIVCRHLLCVLKDLFEVKLGSHFLAATMQTGDNPGLSPENRSAISCIHQTPDSVD